MKYFSNLPMLFRMVVLCCASMITHGNAQAQEVKIGYISSQRIVSEALPYKAASAKLAQEFSARGKELQDMGVRLNDMKDQLEKDAPILVESDILKRRHDLIDMNKEFQRKQGQYQEDVDERKKQELASVLERVRKVLSQIAEKEKYDLLIQDSLYHSPRVDVTDKVIRALNQQ